MSSFSVLFAIFAILPTKFGFAQQCVPKTSEIENSLTWTNSNSNSTAAAAILPPCVSPIKNQWKGRFRPGVANGDYEAVLPPWFNPRLATIGQKFAAKYWFAKTIGMMEGVVTVYMIPDVSYAISNSGNFNNVHSGLKRLMSNILQDSVWYKENLFSVDLPNLHKSITKLRTIHLTAFHKLMRNKTAATPPEHEPLKVNAKLWTAIGRDLNASWLAHAHAYGSIPELGKRPTPYAVNQFGMSAALWGLVAMPLIRPQSVGIPTRKIHDEEIDGFLHFWAVVGHALGIEDEFNVCLQPNGREAKIYFERFLNELLVPYMFKPTYESKVLVEMIAKTLAHGLGMDPPTVVVDFFLQRTFEDLVRIPTPNLTARLNGMGRMVRAFWDNLFIPAMTQSKNVRNIVHSAFDGFVSFTSYRVYGFGAGNKSIVAENAFSQ